MNIGVIGMGVVGSAVYNAFEKKFPIAGYDKHKESDEFDALLESDIVFLCVPTPTQMAKSGLMGFGTGQNLQAVYTSLAKLREKQYRGVVALKSTVLPGTSKKLAKEHPDMIILSNPEFLNSRTANEEFENCKKVLIGGDNSAGIELLVEAYKSLGVEKAIITTHTEAETTKYVANVLGAVKVATANELYDVCKERKTNYQLCADLAVEMTGWIHPEHLVVPFDGMLGLGGECLPKDLQAILCKNRHLQLFVLEAACRSTTHRRKGTKDFIPNRKNYKVVNLKPEPKRRQGRGRNN